MTTYALALDPYAGTKYKSTKTFLQDLRGPRGKAQRITVDDLDILMLRNDPSQDLGRRSWAQQAGIVFGRAAMRRGVIVLNDPEGLNNAINKMYFQLFPEEVRPDTLITRDRDEIKEFARKHSHDVVIKPLQGSGGQGVFRIVGDQLGNLNQMIESISRDGYVVAQQYLPLAAEGDMRLFMMNGQPFDTKASTPHFVGSAPATTSAAISMRVEKRPRQLSMTKHYALRKLSDPSWWPTACSSLVSTLWVTS